MDNRKPVKTSSALALGLLLLPLATVFSAPEESLDPGEVVASEEAPEYLFQYRIGDSEVGFDLVGSWTATLTAGAGLLYGPDATLDFLDTMDDITPGIVFSQSPDITASVTIQKKFFLDVSASATAAISSLLMGYRGDESDAVQHLLIGTRGIKAEPSAFLEIPEQGATSFGVSALIHAGTASHEGLLRWDSHDSQKKIFLGQNEYTEERIQPGDFIQGRFFFLPDESVEDLTVFLEDVDGTYTGSDGLTYREADYDDVELDSEAGLVSLKDSFSGRILVWYTKGSASVGDSSLGEGALPDVSQGWRDLSADPVDFSWTSGEYLGKTMLERRIAVGGIGHCLMLWEPGDSSPFQICGSYASSTQIPTTTGCFYYGFEAKDVGAVIPTGITFQSASDGWRLDAYAASGSRRLFANAWPLPDADGSIYGKTGKAAVQVADYQILTQILTPVDEYVLDSDLVPGSVTVLRNGFTETRFEVDYDTGVLTFLTTILATDRLEVHYRKSASTTTGGDLLFTWTDRIAVSDLLSLAVYAGVRWNLNAATYSEEANASTGVVIGGGHAEGSMGGFSWSADAAVAVTDPDTTGYLRLFGMEGLSYDLDLDEDSQVPASPPVDSGISALAGLNQENRGKLFYKNYREYDVFGASTLMPISWSGFATVPYADGGWMGPYLVLGSSGGGETGSSLVLDYSLDSDRDWVGFQVPLADETDLSGTEAVTVSYYGEVDGTCRLYIQAGAIDEDIDGSGVIAAESSTTSTGYDFVDLANGVTLLVGAGPRGTGNGIQDSKDANGNGILDIERSAGIVTIAGPTFSPGDTAGWNSVSYALSDSERALLADCRAVRILIVRVGSGAVTGKVRLDSVRFDGAAFVAAADSGSTTATVTLKDVDEDFCAAAALSGNDLETAFPTVADVFHPDDDAQEVLEISWAGVTDHWTAKADFSGGTEGAFYDELVFYLRMVTCDYDSDARIRVTFLDTDGMGFHWEEDLAVLAASTDWQEVRISRSELAAYLNDIKLSSVPSWDTGAGSLSRFTLKVSGSENGVMILDEVHLAEPQITVGAAVAARAAYKQDGTILAAGDVALLSNLSAEGEVRFTSAGFTSLYGTPATDMDLLARVETEADLPGSHAAFHLQFRETEADTDLAGGHSILVNRLPFPLSFSDVFSLSWLGDLSRKNTLEGVVGGVLKLSADAEASSESGVLTQEWVGSLGFSPLPQVGLTAKLEGSQSSDGWSASTEWYGAQWILDYGLLVPWTEGTDTERLGDLELALKAGTEVVRLEATACLDVEGTDYTDTTREQTSTTSLKVSLPVTLPIVELGGVTVGFSYERELSLTSTETAGVPFLTEAESAWNLLGAHTYLWTEIPFVEILLDPASEILPLWSGFGYGSYKPEASLSFTKGFGSRLLDLLIPSQIDIGIGRVLEKESDLSDSELVIEGTLSTKALNLFGALGSMRTLPFYRTDEFGWGLVAQWEGLTFESLTWSKAVATLSLSFLGFHEESLGLEDQFQWNAEEDPYWIDTAKAVYGWTQRPDGGLSFLPLLPQRISAKGYVGHSESLKVVSRMDSSGDPYHPLTLSLVHSTSFVFPDFGTFKASATLSGDIEDEGSAAYIFRAGLSVSLEAKLSI